MLTINYSPVRMDNTGLILEWNDPILTVSGDTFDLSEMDDGDDAVHEILLTAKREGSDYEVTIKLPHGANAAYSTRFPSPLMVVSDGDVAVPEYNKPVIVE